MVLTWIKGKGAEVPSVQYSGPDGPVNSGAISTFLDRTIVSENRLIRIPPALPLREAALLGCALPTGAGTVLNGLQVRPGSSLAVFGAGGVGLSAILAARLVNAAPLIAIDVVDHKLEQARRLGASHCIHALRQDPVTALMELTGGRGVDFAVEAAGRPETMEAAIASVRAGGGHVSLAGNLPAGARIELDPFDLIRGKQVTGSWGGDTDPDRDLPRYATLFAAGALPLAELITHTYPLEEINQAFSDLEASLVGRALVVNQGKERP